MAYQSFPAEAHKAVFGVSTSVRSLSSLFSGSFVTDVKAACLPSLLDELEDRIRVLRETLKAA